MTTFLSAIKLKKKADCFACGGKKITTTAYDVGDGEDFEATVGPIGKRILDSDDSGFVYAPICRSCATSICLGALGGADRAAFRSLAVNLLRRKTEMSAKRAVLLLRQILYLLPGGMFHCSYEEIPLPEREAEVLKFVKTLFGIDLRVKAKWADWGWD